MNHITIKIPAASAPFLIRAIEAYSESLINTVKESLDAPNWSVSTAAEGGIVASLNHPITATWGYKKDGTPKQSPGRPVRKARK